MSRFVRQNGRGICAKGDVRKGNKKKRLTSGSWQGRLREGDLDGLAIVTHGASTTDALHDGVVAATAAGGVHTSKRVAGLARCGVLVLTVEDAGSHVRSTLGTLHRDVVALHVDVAADIESTLGTEGVLGPGLEKSTEDGQFGVFKSVGAGRRHACCERDGDLLSRLEAYGNGGLVHIDGHTAEAIGFPAEEDQVAVGVVGEYSLPVAILADPETTVVGDGVFTNRADTEVFDTGIDAVEQVGHTANNVLRLIGLGLVGLRNILGWFWCWRGGDWSGFWCGCGIRSRIVVIVVLFAVIDL